MEEKKVPSIRLKQVWELPLPSWYTKSKSDDITAFYMITGKNSGEMWKVTRIWSASEEDIKEDPRHNSFIHRAYITERGKLIGKEVNLKAIKLLYGKK